MTKQPNPATTDPQSVDTIERIAGVLAQLSSELTEISARLKPQTEGTERDDPGREAANRTREPFSGAPQRIPVSRAPDEPDRGETATTPTGTSPTGASPAATSPAGTDPAGISTTDIALGEPVDTSFARPARIPAATAAGSARGRLRPVAGFAGSVGLLGLVVVVTVALTRGWYGPLAQVLVGALLGAALFAGAFWLHHKSTGRPL